jgi:multiple sugar transport system substrate-binding protein
MRQLRGITWDHIRGVAPIRAATEEFENDWPDVAIAWEARSLKDFEDYPVDILAETYDLILIDHPFVGMSAEKGVLVPLDEWLPAEYLADQRENSVGRSYASYTWNEHQWALAVDAASQVSAYRPDLMEALGVTPPRTWDEVFELITALPDEQKVAMPLNPTHAYCSFLALCANIGGHEFWKEEAGIDLEVGEESLDLLRRLTPLVHQSSLESSPIKILDLMSSYDEIAYAPLIFGYSNYSRADFAPRLVRFTNIPSTHEEPAGGILGGVGLAISSNSEYVREAVDFAAYVAGERCQRGLYFESGGQPGYRAAWTDRRINDASNNFFEATLRTLDLAYMRPRRPGYNPFQERAGKIVHEFLLSGGNAREVVRAFNRAYGEVLRSG